MATEILNEQEKAIKERLLQIGYLVTNDRAVLEVAKGVLTPIDKKILSQSYRGDTTLAGETPFGKVDDRVTDWGVKWILTGDREALELFKDWYLSKHASEILKTDDLGENKSSEKDRVKPGYIYIIRAGDHYKIGRGSRSVERVKQHQTSSPIEIEHIMEKKVDKPVDVEQELHQKFGYKRVRGEWFRLDPEDVELIERFLEQNSVETH